MTNDAIYGTSLTVMLNRGSSEKQRSTVKPTDSRETKLTLVTYVNKRVTKLKNS